MDLKNEFFQTHYVYYNNGRECNPEALDPVTFYNGNYWSQTDYKDYVKNWPGNFWFNYIPMFFEASFEPCYIKDPGVMHFHLN